MVFWSIIEIIESAEKNTVKGAVKVPLFLQQWHLLWTFYGTFFSTLYGIFYGTFTAPSCNINRQQKFGIYGQKYRISTCSCYKNKSGIN